LIDGQLRWQESASPYVFNGAGATWDTTNETNGAHALSVVAYATGGGTATATAAVTIANATTVPPTASPPTNTTPPAITGTAKIRERLKTSLGTWTGSPTSYSYQWRRCDLTGANCADIPEATAQRYQVAPDDADFTLRVSVTATNAGGSASATSAPTAAVPESPKITSSLSRIGSLSGQVQWTATVSGVPASNVERVEFFIDGALVWTERLSPYVFNGDTGLLYSSLLSVGRHVFAVKVTTMAGATANTRTSIRIQAP
jgi:hypothetical protein